MKNLGLALPDKIQEALQANQSAIDDDSLKFPDLTQLNAIRQISAAELDARIKAGNAPVLIDVREPDEYKDELGHLDGSRLIPLRVLPAKAAELDNLKASEIVVVCRSGVRSTTAAAILTGTRLRAREQSQRRDARMERDRFAGRALNISLAAAMPARSAFDLVRHAPPWRLLMHNFHSARGTAWWHAHRSKRIGDAAAGRQDRRYQRHPRRRPEARQLATRFGVSASSQAC